MACFSLYPCGNRLEVSVSASPTSEVHEEEQTSEDSDKGYRQQGTIELFFIL